MKIKLSLILTLLLFALFCLLAACQTVTEKKANNNTASASPAATSSPVAVSPKNEMEKPAGGSLATPTDTYKTAYLARAKKDIAGLKRVFSKELLEFFAEISKADNKSVDDALKELGEQPQAATDACRNEKIDGNKATLEYQDEKGAWKTMDFVKEGDEWKMTIPSPTEAEREEIRKMNQKEK